MNVAANHTPISPIHSKQAAYKPPIQLLASLELNRHHPIGTPDSKPTKMATREAKVSLLDDRIDVLNRNAVEGSPAKQVFRTVSNTLALVRVSTRILRPPVNSHREPNQDKLIDDKDSVQLSEYCFDVCDVLKTAIQGRDVDGLDESVRTALEDLERCVNWSRTVCPLIRQLRVTHEIERTLRRGASMPQAKHNDIKVKEHRLKIQGIFDTLRAPSAPLPVDSRSTATTSKSESGMSSVPPSPILCGVLVTRR